VRDDGGYWSEGKVCGRGTMTDLISLERPRATSTA
jgi:hypothetical protein